MLKPYHIAGDVSTTVLMKEKLTGVGQEVVASTLKALATAMKTEMLQLGKVIREMGIRAD